MAKKVSENDILDMSQDWGRDPANNLPFSGKAVQKFIKETFDKKMGCFYYDPTTNRYLVFSSEENKDKYVDNPLLTELVLGAFDAPFNYTAEISLISKPYVSIPIGTTGNYVEFTFDTKNKSGASIGEDVICTYTIFRGSTKKTVNQKYRAGTVVKFNVDDYLGEGTNRINISIVGQDTFAATSVGVTYQVANLTLTDDTNISSVYDLSGGSKTLEVPFTVTGSGIKVVEWYVDGDKLEFEKNVDEVVDVSSKRTKHIVLSDLSRGTHYVEFRAYILIDGEKFYSKTLHRDVIVENFAISDKSPIVALSYEKDNLEDETISLQQYLAYDLKFSVHNPLNTVSTDAQILLDNKELTTIQTQNGVINVYSIVPTKTGKSTVKVVVGETIRKLEVVVEKNHMGIEEIISNLELGFSSVGRSNKENNKETWEGNGHTATLSGVNFTQTSGWVNNKLILQKGAKIAFDYSPLSSGSTAKGKTIEFEFASSNVTDDSAVLCNLIGDTGSGIVITASEAKIVSRGGVNLSVKYKSEENLRISFVVNKATNTTNKGLVFVYVNGIISGAINFAASDDFISNKSLVFEATNKAEIILRQIRVYNTALSSDQILNNYILYRETTKEMLEVFDRNDIFEKGTLSFSVDKLQGQLPVMVVTGDIPVLENTTNKNTQITVDIDYYNLQHPEKSFSMKNAAMRPQGTSSMLYPKKNFRIYTKKLESTVLTVNGNVVPDKLYSFTDRAQPVNCWCLKADYAESSGTHNTGVARLWNEILFNATLDGEYVFRTEAQKKAIESGYPYDVRTTIDGFPILVLYRKDEDSDLIFIGKYNFNNDKSTESVFGFKGIPGFDNSRMQCWEILNNGDKLALFTDVSDFDTRWKEAYESRYPDTSNPNTADLKAFSVWINSVKGNQAKFDAEKGEHLNLNLMAAYYVYLMRFGAVDQVVKNAMFTSEDGVHFFYINYDNDTVNGLRNNGVLVFDPMIDRQSLDPETGGLAYAYAGHDSVLWNLLEGSTDFMELVKKVDNALYTSGLRYDNIIKYFDEKQADKWNERVYNQDAQYKYIGPYTDAGINNLLMLQGKRQSHRKWWLSRRFSLYDSKFVSGDFKGKALEFKVINNTQPGWTFSIKAGTKMEYGYGVYNPIQTGVLLNEGVSHTFTMTQTLNIGDPVRIYSAINLMGVDLSNILSRLSNVELNNVWNASLGTKLRELILGNGTSTNEILTTISSISKAKRLEKLDIRGCKGITSMDLTELLYLKTFLAKGSGLTGIEFAKGATVTSVSLPRTMQVLRLEELTFLTPTGLELEEDGVNLRSIRVSNCPYLSKGVDLIIKWLNSKTSPDHECSFYMDKIIWSGVAPEQLLKICKAKTDGVDIILKGVIKLTSSSQEIIDTITAAFGPEVFNPANELYINAPDSIFLSGPSTIVEGDTAKYKAIVFSEYMGNIRFIFNTTRPGVTFNEQTGEVFTTENGGTDRQLSVRVIHYPTQGVAVHADKIVTIKKRKYPEYVVINGNGNLNAELNRFSWSYTDTEVTGSLRTEWELTGAITAYAEIHSHEGNTCEVRKTNDSSEVIEGNLVAKLYSVTTNALKNTVIKPITVLNPDVIMSKVSNPVVMNIMFRNGLCANENFMTRAEAASVSDVQLNPTGLYNGSIFRSIAIDNFEELEYFIGLDSIPAYCFVNCGLKKFKFPPNIKSIGDWAFGTDSGSRYSYFEELTIPEGVTELGSYIINGNGYNYKKNKPEGYSMRLHLPSTLKVVKSKAFYDVPISQITGFSEGLTTIEDNAFSGFTGTELILPNSLITLQTDAFRDSNLNEFILPPKVTTVFKGIGGGKNCVIHLHKDVSSFQGNQYLCKAFTVAPENTTYKLENGMIVNGYTNIVESVPPYLDAEEVDFSPYNNVYRCSKLFNVKRIKLGNKNIFDSYHINGNLVATPMLEEVILTSGVTIFTLQNGHLFSSDKTILYKLVKAASFTIPIETTKIRYQHYCNVDDLTIPDNGASLDDIFQYYKGRKVTILGNHSMGNAFVYANGLEEVDLSNGGGYLLRAFINSSLKRISLSANVGMNGAMSVFNNSKVESITIPEGVTDISYDAFNDCENLAYLELPSTMTSYAFPVLSGCVNLKTIVCKKTVAPRANYTSHFGGESGRYTGMNTKSTGENSLYVPSGAGSYANESNIKDRLLNPDICGFTLKATL